MEALAAEIRSAHGVETLIIPADLAIAEAHEPVVAALKVAGREADILVNNAGFSLPQTFAATTWSQQRDFIMTLVVAVTGLTHAVLPGMIARKRGSVINVGSIVALSPGAAGHTLYPAAKSFVVKFSQSLDAEVRHNGIRVTCVLPGPTESEFTAVNGTKDIMAKTPRALTMTAERVVELTLRANDKGKPLCIPGLHNKIGAGLMKYLPDALVTAIVRSASEKYRVKD